MNESARFEIVFAKLRAVVAQDARDEPAQTDIGIPWPAQVSPEELDEIDSLRRIVIEAMEPEPLSFTTT